MILTLETPASYTCPQCLHWPISKWQHGELAGTLCNRCGWKRRDLRHVPHEYRCTCGRPRGDVWLLDTMKSKAVQALLRDRYCCDQCAGARLAKGLQPRPWMNVRYEVFCACGCGKQVAWNDFPETVPLDFVNWKTSLYFHTPCAQAGRAEKSIKPSEILLKSWTGWYADHKVRHPVVQSLSGKMLMAGVASRR